MAQRDERQPNRTYRGTVDEVFSHRDEIPADAIVELKVITEQPEAEEGIGDFSGRSLADLINEIGTVTGLPSDVAARPEKYMRV